MSDNNIQHITLTGDPAAFLAALCRRRKAQVQIHVQARGVSIPSEEVLKMDTLADTAAAMYEAFAVAADIRIKRYEFEKKIKAYCEELREDMAD